MKKTNLTIGLLLLVSLTTYAITLPRLVSDGMVLQREVPINIWGWANPGETIKLDFSGNTYETVTEEDGQWLIVLGKQKAGGPHQMKIYSDKEVIQLKNILIGEVWICSGQSNMELPIYRVLPLYKEEIAGINNPNIRTFYVPRTYDFKAPLKDFSEGNWKTATPENILNFSATAFFFGQALYEQYQVPIGLINTSLGGSPAEAWMSEDALKEFPAYFAEAQLYKNDRLIEHIQQSDQYLSKAWSGLAHQLDKGYEQENAPWYDPSTDFSEWKSITVPGLWDNEVIEAQNGVVWFEKSFELPASAKGKAAELELGAIVDADSVFLNGTFIGTTSYKYPPRRYTIPTEVLKDGKNTLIVRVISVSGQGGFVTDKPYELRVNGSVIDLKGSWRYKTGVIMSALPGQTFIRWKPLGLYNAMIAPLLNYNMRGVIWYQGESNVSRAEEYDVLFPAMIRNWRYKWGKGDFPFLYVQLANFLEEQQQPMESGWARLREAQLKALNVPNTGMAVITDIGEWNDIHPMNKKEVGKRLALNARHFAYQEDLVYSGPIYQSYQILDNKIELSFNHTGSGLETKGGKLKGFAIAGRDQQFVWAEARIEGDKVIVWSKEVDHPVAVRYGWADNPAAANLYNKEGLPASPFRTDDF